MFFFLLQTEYGDIFKVTLDHETDKVKELKIKYFDTIPVTSSMCVLKSGFLFAASEFGNHVLYQCQAIGEEEDVEASSATLLETEEGFQPVFFQPRGLKNLVRIDQVESLMPIMDMKVSNLVGVLRKFSDSGFLDTTPPLAVSLIGDDSLMQIHPNGIRHIREDGRINEWRTPAKRTIVKVGSNRLTVVIALSGGELIYFEVDITGQLMEVEKHEMSGDVACLGIAEGRQRS
ncbi:hypothetical protein OIU77_013410 [Salix suchowensis]|uniref:Cleavage/polyadenylation specificity factor A subunit N-terminal domain-containing protein n=1 Tax=Salix suchowensis TaxID=1278906 RepID=A0ABQ8ZU29_9ROSI|nr:hypothetical protein OIU77_013410 [Salix suchowensis]